MTTLTKLLPLEAAPAQPILDRAHPLQLTLAQRVEWPSEVKVEGDVVTFAVTERRPLEVNDVFVDDKGEFWVVHPAVEKVLHVTGDIDLMREAAGALINRGVRVAEAEGGFAVVAQESVAKMLTMIGLEITEVEEGFDPIRIEYRRGGCCGGHGHHGGGCGCGGHHHHHHHEEECGCGCGGEGHHHHHDDECGCGCGGEGHHHHGEGECCCGGEGHHHHHDDECGCGCGGEGHHHHGEGECCCGGEGHHHHHDGECGCGCGGEGHHHHGEGKCRCGGEGHGHHHEEGDSCCKQKA